MSVIHGYRHFLPTLGHSRIQYRAGKFPYVFDITIDAVFRKRANINITSIYIFYISRMENELTIMKLKMEKKKHERYVYDRLNC